jgi:hypothetical protein
MPSWRQGQGVNEWREIPGSAMSLCSPTNTAVTAEGRTAVVGPSSRLNTWCGLSIDTRNSQVWSLANGGHGDYYGNEVLKLDLMADVPAWVEWMPGSSGAVVDYTTLPTDPSHARYRDGLPCSAHSYYGQQFIERQDRALRMGGSTSPIGSCFENVEGFRSTVQRGSNGWDAAGTFGFAVGGVNGGWTVSIGWSACKDPVTEIIYVVNAPYIRKFTPATSGVGGVWSILSVQPNEINTGALGATAVDWRRNRLLWLKGYGPNVPYTCDLASGTWTTRSHPASAAKAEFDALLPSLGMVYVAQLDAYLVRGGAAGDKVYRIDATTYEISMLATTGGSAIPQSPPLSNEENVYNRWLFVPALEGVVYFPRSESNAWFLRLY